MKVKNTFLASLLTTLGQKVKAELVVDDVNGTSHTFPDITEISEIAEGVSISSPDGTYVIADGEDSYTIVVLAGVVTSIVKDEPAEVVEASLDAEVAEVLTAIVEASKKQKETIIAQAATIATLQADLKDFKASFKHDKGDEKPKQNTNKFKTV